MKNKTIFNELLHKFFLDFRIKSKKSYDTSPKARLSNVDYEGENFELLKDKFNQMT